MSWDCFGGDWKERRLRWRIVIGGRVCAGDIALHLLWRRVFVPYTDCFAYGLSFLFPLRAGAWERSPGRDCRGWRRLWGWPALGGGSASHVHFALHPEHFFMRSQESVGIRILTNSQGEPVEGTF